MGKYTHNDVLDAACDEIATGTIITLCSQEPTTRTEAVTTYALADVTVTPGDGNGDFSVENGSPTGRRVAITAQTAILIDTTGIATHIAICDGSVLLHVTEVADSIHTETAQAGAATTITLSSGASGTDDIYNGYLIKILSGTGAEQTRIITDYVGSTKVATVATWDTNPDATSVYDILGKSLVANGSNETATPLFYITFLAPDA